MTISTKLCRQFLAVSLAATLVSAALAAEDSVTEEWSGWRGPRRDGTVAGTSWPDDFAGLERV